MFNKVKKATLYGLAAIGGIIIVYAVINTIFLGSYGMGFRQLSGVPSVATLTSDSGLNFKTSSFESLDKNSPYASNSRGSDTAKEGQLTQRKVIKNGSLSLLVKEVEGITQQIQTLATDLGGFVSSSQVYEIATDTKYGTVTIRVPANRFDEAVTKIKNLAIKVENEQVNASDVTEQFVDLEAQLKNLRAEEEQYLVIMKRAATVEDTLRVAQRLSDVRGRIESIQGQLQYLSRQVDMSTISVSLNAEADVEIFGIRWRPLFVIKQSFRNMLFGLTGYVDAMIGFVLKLPIIALWLVTLVVVAIVGWKLFRWIRAKFFSAPFYKQDQS